MHYKAGFETLLLWCRPLNIPDAWSGLRSRLLFFFPPHTKLVLTHMDTFKDFHTSLVLALGPRLMTFS
jgi:hypothetical protein